MGERRVEEARLTRAEAGLVPEGDGPCAILMIGARKPDDRLVYPVEVGALRHGAGVRDQTDDSRVAYADLPPGQMVPDGEGDIPGEVDRAG